MIPNRYFKLWSEQEQTKEHWRTLEEATTLYGAIDGTRKENVLGELSTENILEALLQTDERKGSSSCSDSIREYSKRSKRKTYRWPNTHGKDNLWYQLRKTLRNEPTILVVPLKKPKRKAKTKAPTGILDKIAKIPVEWKDEKEGVDEDEGVEDNIVLENILNDLAARPKKLRRTSIPSKPLTSHSKLYSAENRLVSWFYLPLRYHEPITLLQKAAEVYEFSSLLDTASCISDEDKQLAYVAAFSVVPYAKAPFRLAWPFIPCIGETYELDRTDDMGWRLLSEQVSMVPPVIAQYCEGIDWECTQQFYYRVIYLKRHLILCKQTGLFNLTFKSTGRQYTWTKSIAVMVDSRNGKSWIHNIPNYFVLNVEKKSVCHFLFVTYDFYLERKALVKGMILDSDGNAKWVLEGLWNKKLKLSKVKSKYSKCFEQILKNPTQQLHKPKVIWIADQLSKDAHFFYNFNKFTCQLNENDELVAPTDSRRRPDVRAFENADFYTCAELKKWIIKRHICKVPGFEYIKEFDFQEAIHLDKEDYLEDTQSFWFKRKVRRQGMPGLYRYSFTGSEDLQEQYNPIWFKKLSNPKAKDVVYTYRGEKYWTYKKNQEWEYCPEAF